MRLERLKNGKYFVVDYYTGLEVVGKVYHFLGDVFYRIDVDDIKTMVRRYDRCIEKRHIIHQKTFATYKQMKDEFEFEYKLRQCCIMELL